MNPIKCLMKVNFIFLLISADVVIVGKPFETGKDYLTLGTKRFPFTLNEPAEEEAFGPNIYSESTTSVPFSEAAVGLRNIPVELPVVSLVEEEAAVNQLPESSGSRKRHRDDHDSESPTQSARMNPSHADGSRGANDNCSQLQQNSPEKAQSWRGTGEKAEGRCKPLEVHDWNFVIGDEEKQISFSKHGGENFTQHPKTKLFFEGLKRITADTGESSVFWIPREKAYLKVKKLQQQILRKVFCFPKEFAKTNVKRARLHQVVLDLSNASIQLDRYSFYSEELIQKMKTQIESKMHDPRTVESQNKLDRIEQFMEEVTKVAHFLSLIYLSLFKEHKAEILTPNDLENTINFMKNLWFNIEKGKREVFAQYPWTISIHSLFCVNIPEVWPVTQWFQKSVMYLFSWHFFHAWVDSYEEDLTYKTKSYRKTLDQLMNKIIYYSNHETMLESL